MHRYIIHKVQIKSGKIVTSKQRSHNVVKNTNRNYINFLIQYVEKLRPERCKSSHDPCESSISCSSEGKESCKKNKIGFKSVSYKNNKNQGKGYGIL